MNQLPSSIFAALDALLKRAGERRAAATGPAPTVTSATRPRRPGTDPALSPSSTLAPRSVPAPTAANVVRPVPDDPGRTEAGIVRGIFSNPRSLAAAFIAAEILAQPLALRDR